MAIAGALAVAAVSAYGQHQANKSAEKAAQAASGPTTTTDTPWGPSIPYREELMRRAMELYNGGAAAPAPTGGGGGATGGGGGARLRRPDNIPIAQWRSMTRAERRAAVRAAGGGGGAGAASTAIDYNPYIRDILDGRFLNDPYLDAAVAAMRRNSEAQFGQSELLAEQAGRQGGGAHQVFDAALARGVNEAELGMRGDAWKFGAGTVMDALGTGTGYDAALKGIAQQDRASRRSASVARAGIGLDRYKFNTMLPYNQLGSITDIINSAGGGAGTRTTQGPPVYAQTTSPWLAAAQGGLAGYQMAGGWGGGTWGTPTVRS